MGFQRESKEGSFLGRTYIFMNDTVDNRGRNVKAGLLYQVVSEESRVVSLSLVSSTEETPEKITFDIGAFVGLAASILIESSDKTSY